MGKPQMKLVQEVDTCWNSTLAMFQRLYEQREPLKAALDSLSVDIKPFRAEEYHHINQCLSILWPFNTVTTELSEEKRVSESKAIQRGKKMRKHFIAVLML